ncbi:DMT family transporter [Parachitinimonas caeni]|uniref:DMT family transporter n=1 Tax=Parachitinimonas caeni TaxID=3031301 RepID=A0ABT7DZW9_9NEIS|nr:DMT family transporter [Parachitinimonas caeni]MDK2124720.1 DMT family transporter [Parachitinimonas caeni]
MDSLALLLVVSGALLHALWNLAAKRASAGGAGFVWTTCLISVLASSPLAWWEWQQHSQALNWQVGLAMTLSAILHVVYSLVLQRGYRESDFSIVYPIARGSGPMLSLVGAVLVLHEWPSPLGMVGILAVVGGVFVVAGAGKLFRQHEPKLRAGLMWGGITGLFIAAYTVLDGWAIKTLKVPPLFYYASSLFIRILLLMPVALKARQVLVAHWHRYWREALVIGLLSPAAYTLVLYAMQRAPLSYVAPTRELSMLLGTAMAAQLLKEEDLYSRLAGAGLMVVGVVLIAFA